MKIVVLFIAVLGLSSCAPMIKSALKNNPDLIYDVFKEDPGKFMETVNSVARKAAAEAQTKEAEKEKEAMEKQFSNPVKIETASNRSFLGKKDAAITVVEYSDFQCGYCSRAHGTVEQIRKAYGDKVKFIYKHFPVTGAPMSKPAARYFEALSMMYPEKPEKAYQFHDLIFKNQGAVQSKGDAALKSFLTTVVGAKSVATVLKMASSDEVTKRIETDSKQARDLGIQGTPAFAVNGVVVKGARPFEYFKGIIDRQLNGGKPVKVEAKTDKTKG